MCKQVILTFITILDKNQTVLLNFKYLNVSCHIFVMVMLSETNILLAYG